MTQHWRHISPTPLRDRVSIIAVEHGRIDVVDQALALHDINGTTQIPVAGIACIMLEPGTTITHAAIALCARVGTLLVWTGEAGVRLYAAGQPGGASAQHLLFQASVALDETARLKVVRAMYARRFGEAAPERRSIDQLRGMEGARVRAAYADLAAANGFDWQGRRYDPTSWRAADVPNQCVSAATAALYGLSEAAILAAGYAPSIGFLHRGRPLSFVYDIADLFKLETVVPEAFRIAGLIQRGEASGVAERMVRRACRDAFRRSRLLDRIIPSIHEVLAAGEMGQPPDAPEGMAPAFETMEADDVGHRG